jgi:hypothetical protein
MSVLTDLATVEPIAERRLAIGPVAGLGEPHRAQIAILLDF